MNSVAAAILQLALLILNSVNNNPNIPPATANQAMAIAEQASQFANQNAAYIQPAFSQCYSYGYNGCYNPHQNYNPYPNYNPYTPISTYNPYNPSSSGMQLMIFNSAGVDSGVIQSGALYNVIWSPYNSSQGPATVQLYSNLNGNVSFITTIQSNTIPWFVNASPGSYQLRVLQNGMTMVTRDIVVQ